MARIELKALSHSYQRRPHEAADYALQPLDLEWKDGGAYALLGPSGCGKTTLLNIISGLVRPSKGRVLFDGRDVTDLSPQQRKCKPTPTDHWLLKFKGLIEIGGTKIEQTQTYVEMPTRIPGIAVIGAQSNRLRQRAIGIVPAL